MLASHPRRLDVATFLSPGQQFAAVAQFGIANESLTVARLVRDRYGLLHVTMRTGSGREISAFAEQIEFAVSEGHLVPIGSAAVQIPY